MENFENQLLNENNFISARLMVGLVPDFPGLYAIRIIGPDFLPEPFSWLKDQ